jgi:geranylgeranyl transferase type-1 subunit beta
MTSSSSGSGDSSLYIDKEAHALYFLNHLKNLPSAYDSQDAQRLVLSYFCIHGLAILGELKRIDNKKAMIEWVYSHQIHPDARDKSGYMLSLIFL